MGEEKIRQHLILLLRFLCMFRGCDLAKCKNGLVWKQNVCFLSMRRKGQQHWALYPLPDISPEILNPIFWLKQYIALTQSRGDMLFWTLPPSHIKGAFPGGPLPPCRPRPSIPSPLNFSMPWVWMNFQHTALGGLQLPPYWQGVYPPRWSSN